jgi:hypothetical protein
VSYAPVGVMNDLLRLVADHPPPAQLAVDVDAARLARTIKHAHCTRIGLLPANARTNVQGAALAIATALAFINEQLVLILDPERATAPQESPVGSTAEAVFAAAVATGVVRLVPFAPAPTGAKVESIRFLLQFAESDEKAWGHVLADLSGCSLPGELLGVLQLMQGIVIVGTAGVTSEADVRAAASRVPADLAMGVLLVEG